jgi:Flp pilus assembly protein TadG
MMAKTHRKPRGEEGAAAVEFAIVVTLLFTIIFGIMEFGLALFELQNLRSSAREGARVAAVGGDRAAILSALKVGASGSLNSWGSDTSKFTVKVGSPPSTTGESKPCAPASAPTSVQGQQVEVSMPYANLPTNTKSAFQIEIPFIPKITLTPTITGSFRCE